MARPPTPRARWRGTNFNGALLLFDHRTRQDSGDMQLLYVTPAGIASRWDTFDAFLAAVRGELDDQLQRKS